MSARTWASYARLSSAKNDGKGASLAITRQHDENRAYIERVDPGARIIEFGDDGFSGFLDVHRPGFEEMVSRAQAGEFAAVLAWHADRISRQVEVTARVVKACETARVELHTTLGGWHSDPTRLYIESVVAEGESRQKRNRMISKHKQLRAAGGFSGGGRRFGYEPRMTAIRESEAAIIRDLAERALMGEPLARMANSLNRAGVPTAKGLIPDVDKGVTPWYAWTIRAMLMGPHIVGKRTDNDGALVDASWPAIIDLATHDALVLKLADPARRVTGASTKARYLLSGLATCGHCGKTVRGSMNSRRGKAVYSCPNGGTVREIAGTDAVVREYVVARLEQMDAAGLMVAGDQSQELAALGAERAEIPAKRANLAGLMAAGTLDPEGYAAAVSALTRRDEELGAAITVLNETVARPARALEGATGAAAGAVWDAWAQDTTGAGLARQKEVTALLVDVEILPMGKGNRGFDPERVRVTYRDLS